MAPPLVNPSVALYFLAKGSTVFLPFFLFVSVPFLGSLVLFLDPPRLPGHIPLSSPFPCPGSLYSMPDHSIQPKGWGSCTNLRLA